jgi:hypothetical protein
MAEHKTQNFNRYKSNYHWITATTAHQIWRVRVMVLNDTFNILVISWRYSLVGFIGGGNRSTQRKPPTCRKSLTNFIT